jgi:hypothetical protein
LSLLRKTGSTRKWRRLRELILARDRYTCGYCGGVATTVDHIVPRSKAGRAADHPSNLVAACAGCNRAKGSKAFFSDVGGADTSTPCPLSPHDSSSPLSESNYKKRKTTGLDLGDPGPLGRDVAR